MMRHLVVALLVVLVPSLIGPVASAQDATPTTTGEAGGGDRTDVRYVLPFGPDRPDAWDCTGAEGQIYDPCFENPFIAPDEPGQVACFDSPFTTDVVVLTL